MVWNCLRLFKAQTVSPSLTLQRFNTALHKLSSHTWQGNTRLAWNQHQKTKLLYFSSVRAGKSVKALSVNTEPVKLFHTSAELRAIPAPLALLLIKPLQKVAAIILGRSIRKWWKALPPNKKELFREWTWRRRWHLAGAGTGLLLFISLFFLTHMEDSPVTGRTRLLFFSRESFMELAQHASDLCMEEYEPLFIPVVDSRHQVVEKIVQFLTQRNQDIDGINSFPWKVHVVESPAVNAFVLPNGKVFVFTGMLKAVADIHQLTFVLGHEMAHALIGHAAEQASMSHMLDLLSLILLTMIWAICPRDSLAVLGHWIQNQLAQFIFDRPFSRKLEAEADQVGLLMAAKACADVRAGPVFWQQMELTEQLSGEPSTPEWLSTHPSHRNRSTHLDRLVPEALELREKCECPALPATDPRAAFSKTVHMLLEEAEKKESEARKEKEVTVPLPHLPSIPHHGDQPQLGGALVASGLPQTLVSNRDLTESRRTLNVTH